MARDDGQRAPEDKVEQARGFAQRHWDKTLREAERIFVEPLSEDGRTRGNQLRDRGQMLGLIRGLAHMHAGAIHPKGNNTVEEKVDAALLIREAEAMLERPSEVADHGDDQD